MSLRFGIGPEGWGFPAKPHPKKVRDRPGQAVPDEPLRAHQTSREAAPNKASLPGEFLAVTNFSNQISGVGIEMEECGPALIAGK